MAFVGAAEGILKLRDEFTSTLDRAAGKLRSTGKEIKKVGDEMSAVGGRLTASFTAPIGAAGVAASKFSLDFNSSLLKINTQVGISQDVIADWKSSILELSGETAQAPKDLSDAMFFVTSAGLRGADALDALEAGAKAAALGFGEITAVVDASTSVVNAYGSETISAGEATNILALAVKEGKLQAESLAPVIGQLVPTASALGVRFEDVAGTMAVMSKTGLNAARSATSLNAIFGALLKPAESVEKVLNSVGLSSQNLRDVMASPGGILKVLRLLDKRFKGNDEQIAKVIPSIEALRGVMNVLAQDSGSVDSVMASVASSTDVLNKGMRTLADDSGFRLQQLLNRMVVQLTTVGDSLDGVISSMLDFGDSVLDVTDDLIEKFEALPVSAQATILAVLGVAVAIGPVVLVVGQLTIAFSAIAGVAGAAVSAIGGIVGVLAGPVGLAVALAAVVASWEPARAAVIDFASTVVDFAVEAVKSAIDWFNRLQESTENIRLFIVELSKVIADDLLKVGKLLIEWAVAADEALKNIVRQLASVVLESVGVSENVSLLSVVFGDLVSKLASLMEASRDVITALIDMSGGIEALLAAIAIGNPALAGVIDKLKDWTDKAKENVKALEDHTEETWDGVLSTEAMDQAMESVIEEIEKEADALQSAAEQAEELASESDEIVGSQEALIPVITSTTDSLGEQEKALDDAQEGFSLLKEVMEGTNNSFTNIADLAFRLHSALDRGIISQDNFAIAMASLKDRADETQDAFSGLGDTFASVVQIIISGTDDLSGALSDFFINQARSNAASFVDDFTRVFQETRAQGESAADSISAAWSESSQGIAGTANALSAGVAASGGEIIDVLNGVGSAFASYQQGDYVGTVIAGIGTAVGAIKLLFGGKKSVEEKVQELFDKFAEGEGTLRDVNRIASILSRTFDKVANAQFGATRATELLNDNFDEFVDIAFEFGDKGIQAIEKVVKAAQVSGVGMEAIVQKLRSTWTEALDIMEERSTFLQDEAQTIIDSLDSLLDATALGTSESVEFAADSIMQAFTALSSSGLPLVEIVGMLGDTFRRVQVLGVELGVDVGDEFARLGEVIDILSDPHLQNLVNRLSDVANIAEAAGNAGLLTTDQFRFLASTVVNTFNALRRGGLSGEEAVAAIGPQLQILLDLSQQYDEAISDNVQSLLDMGLAQGVLADRSLTTEDILITGFDNLLQGINALIEALGGVPLAFQSWSDRFDVVTESIEEDIQDLIDETGRFGDRAEDTFSDLADGVSSRWDDLGKSITTTTEEIATTTSTSWEKMSVDASDSATSAEQSWMEVAGRMPDTIAFMADRMARNLVDIPVNFDLRGDFDGQGVPGFASGTPGFENFGRGTLVELHGQEQVINMRQGAGVAGMVGDAIRRASMGAAGCKTCSKDREMLDSISTQTSVLMLIAQRAERQVERLDELARVTEIKKTSAFNLKSSDAISDSAE